ncbi:MAG TPA: TraR/DksA family transcriptional regulator [Thermoanaerobaculia bacterium]|nr:TraR/DksA family transcriptional regulator [Thermoanaerobaculia bacterium]
MARTKTKASQFEQYRELLLRKQSELNDSYARDMAAGNAQPDDGIQDLADKAASAYSKELNFSLSDAEREILVLVDEALRRIDENAFGICINCGQVINEKRLKAVPWTRHCIDCQELEEQGLL